MAFASPPPATTSFSQPPSYIVPNYTEHTHWPPDHLRSWQTGVPPQGQPHTQTEEFHKQQRRNRVEQPLNGHSVATHFDAPRVSNRMNTSHLTAFGPQRSTGSHAQMARPQRLIVYISLFEIGARRGQGDQLRRIKGSESTRTQGRDGVGRSLTSSDPALPVKTQARHSDKGRKKEAQGITLDGQVLERRERRGGYDHTPIQ